MTPANCEIQGWTGESVLPFQAYRRKIKSNLLERLCSPKRPLSEIVSSIRLVSTCSRRTEPGMNCLILWNICEKVAMLRLSLDAIRDHFGPKSSDIILKNFLPIDYPKALSSVQGRKHGMQ